MATNSIAPDRPSLQLRPRERPAVNLRSIGLGLAGTIFICGMAPYNDHVLGNTHLVGNFLPVGLMMVMTVLVLAVNAPLRALKPQGAFSTSELAVVLVMTLVSCTLPTSGLMRYLPAYLAGIPFYAGMDAEIQSVLGSVNPPAWLFPSMQSNDPVITGYWNRAVMDGTGFSAWLNAVPWSAWATPALAWGALVAFLYSAVLCLAVIVRRQWTEVERLSFPLATVFVSLIEEPRPDRWVNDMLRSRRFWLAAAVPFVLHGSHALMVYTHGAWPEIPSKFDLRPILSDPPWSYAGWGLRSSNLFFSVIGITFFVQTKVAFSLWSMFVAAEVMKMTMGSLGQEMTPAMQRDEVFGAITAFAAALLWTGRHHWLLVLRQMFRPSDAGEETGEPYLSYRLAGWILIASIAGIIGWLMLAGASLAGAAVTCGMMLLMFLVIARVVAETGLLYVNLGVPLVRPWVYMIQDLPQALAVRTTLRSYFFSNLLHAIFTNDLRECLSVYASHALRVNDATRPDPSSDRKGGFRVVGAMVLALSVGYIIAGASMLLVEYHHAATFNTENVSPINSAAMSNAREPIDQTLFFIPPRRGQIETHSHLGHFATGTVATGLLSILHLRFTGFPFHPVGFLAAYSQSMQSIWFSVMVGWLAKVVVLRTGGASMLRWCRAIFIGLIVGESLAAGFWLVFNLSLSLLGYLCEPVQLLPG